VSRLLSIGEFSKVTHLTVKTLRHYHERGLLIPARIDAQTGYRYYDDCAIERAAVIAALKDLEVPLDDILEILAACSDDDDALEFLERQRERIRERLEKLKRVNTSLDRIITTQREARNLMIHQEVVEQQISSFLIAAIRVRGSFDQVGDIYKRLGRAIGFGLSGSPGMLVYDEEYRPGDSDFEPYFPIKDLKEAKREKIIAQGISVREIAGGRALTLIHCGPYDKVSPTYAKLFQAARTRNLNVRLPTREVYIKGPGMIFKGNPENYVTEVQMLVEEARDEATAVPPGQL
jgi:DNA-binding transcriptional MerR regulator